MLNDAERRMLYALTELQPRLLTGQQRDLIDCLHCRITYPANRGAISDLHELAAAFNLEALP